MSTNEFVIVPRGPFSLARAADVVAHFPPLRHQPRPTDGTVRLGFVADRTFDPVAVTIRVADYLGVLRVTAHGIEGTTTTLQDVRKQVSRIFALDVDGSSFPEIQLRDAHAAALMAEYEGLRPVSFTSPYECACWAILSHRVTTTQAANRVKALVDAHGATVDGIGVFPSPRVLLTHTDDERLRGIAEAALDGELDAATLRALPATDAIDRLKKLPGIGELWSRGIWLRACGVHDYFHDGEEERPELAERYRPFGMWIAFLGRVASRRSSGRPHEPRATSTRRRGRRAA